MTRPILSLTELIPGVYTWRRASNGGIAPYRAQDGGRGLLLIDTGADDRAAQGLLEWVDRLAASEIAIANTHGHRDHTWGNAALAARGASLLAPPVADGEPGEEVEIFLNDLLVKCIALPGHTPDSRALVVRGVAFAGDAVYTPDILRRMPVPAFLDLPRAMASLEALEAWLTGEDADPEPPARRWLVAGHGRPLHGDEAVQAVAATREAVERAMAALEDVLGPPSYGPAPVPGDDEVAAWLEAMGTAPQHASAIGVWRQVAAGYAGELARRRGVSAP